MQRIEPFSGYQTYSNGVCVDAEMLLQLEEAAVPGGADDSLIVVSLTHVLTMSLLCPFHVSAIPHHGFTVSLLCPQHVITLTIR